MRPSKEVSLIQTYCKFFRFILSLPLALPPLFSAIRVFDTSFLAWQNRRNATLQALQKYSEASTGQQQDLQKMDGFHPPYNNLFWAISHSSVPFSFVKNSVPFGKAKYPADFVVMHPIALAEGKQLEHYEGGCVNQSWSFPCLVQVSFLTRACLHPGDPQWPWWAALLDCKLQEAFSVGEFHASVNRRPGANHFLPVCLHMLGWHQCHHIMM